MVRPAQNFMDDREETKLNPANSTFRLSPAPVVDSEGNRSGMHQDFRDLPRSYGKPVVFAMARDPKTLFVYWDIDWPKLFAAVKPADRKVYLRLSDTDGAELNFVPVEPMARSREMNVAPAKSYRVELGYFNQGEEWYSVGKSEVVETPTDKMGSLSAGDFAIVPFHITFQRLTDLFRATRTDQGSLVQSLAHLQEKSLHPEVFGSLAPEEREVYRAMKASISERTYLPNTPTDRADEARLQKKLEKVLGFSTGLSSSSLGGSSRT
jgi:hypothetical protein